MLALQIKISDPGAIKKVFWTRTCQKLLNHKQPASVSLVIAAEPADAAQTFIISLNRHKWYLSDSIMKEVFPTRTSDGGIKTRASDTGRITTKPFRKSTNPDQ